jgi:hypothetical protein
MISDLFVQLDYPNEVGLHVETSTPCTSEGGTETNRNIGSFRLKFKDKALVMHGKISYLQYVISKKLQRT